MKRWIWALLGLLAVSFFGGERSAGVDVAKLRPVEVLVVTRSDGQLLLRTDTGDTGRGKDVPSAIADLKSAAPAEVFLETGEYLLLTEECLPLIPSLMEYLRPSCSLCLLEGEPDMEKVAQYLKIHQPKVTLAQYRGGIRDVEKMVAAEGRMELVP